jgi:hypothetical protein
MGPAHLQVLFADFQLAGREFLFFSSSQHSSSFLVGCFFPQFLQIGASLYLCFLSSRFFFFSSFDCFPDSFVSFLMSDIISFIASVVLFIRVSICRVCFSVRAAISSSVAYACSSIMFALKFFAVSLFCLFSFAYSDETKVLMFCHVLLPAGRCSHSRTAASNSPEALR